MAFCVGDCPAAPAERRAAADVLLRLCVVCQVRFGKADPKPRGGFSNGDGAAAKEGEQEKPEAKKRW